MSLCPDDPLARWNALAQPPAEALTRITGGRLKGMTDIKPQWRLKAMTEQYGPCGEGWRYTIERLWTEPGTNGEVCAFALVNLQVRSCDGEWCAPIPGVGGSMLVAKETRGLHTSDECYKMAVTDALSVAMKAIGVAAEVYMGNWDGSKYREAPNGEPAPSLDRQNSIKREWLARRHELHDASDGEKKRAFSAWFCECTGQKTCPAPPKWTEADMSACQAQLAKEYQAGEIADAKQD